MTAMHIDNLLGELGLHPDAIDPDEAASGLSKVARYRRERTPMERERTAQRPRADDARPSLASSFLLPWSCGLRRGRATCQQWHLTSAKNIDPSKSTDLTGAAGRNHSQPQSADES